jgi:hypothetical protein
MLRFFANKLMSRLTSSVVLMAFLIGNLIMPLQGWALTSGPSQPESTQFAPAGSSDMVNLFTGDFSYNIPLMDVEGYPININYNAAISMEDEASWVGLGWSLNPGSVSRAMRGMPDEFNGDIVKRRVGMKDYVSNGGMMGVDVEYSGVNSKNIGGFGFNTSLAIGATHNNQRGWGAEFAFDMGMSANIGKQTGHNLGAGVGLGLKTSSLDGASFRHSYGLTYGYSGRKGTKRYGGSLGVNYSPSMNSRSGVWDQTWSASISGNYSKPGYVRNDLSGFRARGGGGLGTNSSVFIPAASLAFSPQLPFNTQSSMWTADIKVGGGSCNIAGFGTIRGFHSETKVRENDKHFKGYGYLHEGMANSSSGDGLLDFSREKDGTTYKESTNLPITSHNYDLFSLNSQGLMGAFRAHRNDIGTVYDAKTTESSGGFSASSEIAFGDGSNVGVNLMKSFGSGESGYWASELQGATKFRNEAQTNAGVYSNNEVSYFSFAGEKTIGDKNFKQLLGGESPVYSDLQKVSRKNYKTNATYLGGSGSPVNTSSAAFDNAGIPSRKPREVNVSTLNVSRAKDLAVEKKLRSYRMNWFKLNTSPNLLGAVQHFGGAAEIDRDNVLASVSNIESAINDHISEITSTDASGSRYVYGLPVYNLYQKDVTFATEAPQDPDGYVSFANENDLLTNVADGNGKGRDGYIESTINPAYTYAHLLTAVLSPDYVDLTDNGPTPDDYGTYVKFNYSQAGDVAWRSPMCSNANKAQYNEGFYADVRDNKASYTYGMKQRWYVHSIETKNYVAFFEMSDREDGTGPQVNFAPTLGKFNEESSGAQPNSYLQNLNATQSPPFSGLQYNRKQKRLDKIILYNKQDLINNAGNAGAATPIKTVNFAYDYSLCKGVPNNTGVQETPNDPHFLDNQGGKLTLKKIWFTYGITPSTKGLLSPYEFAYNDQSNHDFLEDGGNDNANFNYEPRYLDRWGNYKPAGSPLDNVIYPYVQQQSKATQDLYSRAWCLNTIKTPSGGVLKVDYESDDYAHVMEKRAGQMFNSLGFATSIGGTPSGKLYTKTNSGITYNNYLVVDIASVPSGLKDAQGNDVYGLPGSFTTQQAEEYVNTNYLKDVDGRLFFKTKIHLTGLNKDLEFIQGFADYTTCTPIKSQGSSGNYDRLYFLLKSVPNGDKQSNVNIHPFVKAGLQMGRKYLNDLMNPYPVQSNYSPIDFIKQLAGSFGEVKAMFSGVNTRFIDKGYCQYTDPSLSFVRLTNPNLKKLGGGNRVKRIANVDAWSDMMPGENSSAYTQVYDYSETDAQGRIVSTGVASYEPLLGGDENPYRVPSYQAIKSSLSTNDELMTENPIGESFLPSGYVGYAKVSVKNVYDNPANTTVKRHGTGHTEYAFYTARDFPAKFEQSGIKRQIVSPKKIVKLLTFTNLEKMYVTQGYVIKTNDMHGKAKSVEHFAEDKTAAISGVRYEYKRNGNELVNTVDVMDGNNTVSSEEVGVDMDIVNDSRQSKNNVKTFSAQVNVAIFSCSLWIPLVFAIPAYSKVDNQFYSMTTTKTIQKYGLVDKVVAFDNNSLVETQNVLYDKTTGEVLLTKTKNQYDDPVYNFTYPAHWVYSGMGSAALNNGVRFVHTSASPVINTSTGLITNSSVKGLLHPGDEIAVYDAQANGSNYTAGAYKGTKYWVVRDLVSGSATYNELYLLDQNGVKANLGGGDLLFEVSRSGRRNQQALPIGALTALANPIVNGNLQVSAATKLTGSSAVEYDDKWNFYGSYVEAKDPAVNPCTPVYTNLFTTLQKLLNAWQQANLTSAPYKLTLFKGYSITPPHNPELRYLNYGISTTDFDALLVNNGFPVSSLLSTASNNLDYIYFQVIENPITSTVELKLVRQKQSYSTVNDYTNIGSPTEGSCKITLTKISTPPVNTNDALGNQATFSGLITNLPGRPANVLQVTINFTNTWGGLYEGAVPCGNLSSGCPNNACANSIPGAINPYFQNVRGNYMAKRSFSYLTNRQTGIVQAGGVMKGDVRDDGVYTSFNPFWNYVSGQGWQPIYKLPAQTANPKGIFDNWVMQSEVNKVDREGNVLQTQNAIKRPSASLYGYNFTRGVASAANALYTDIAFDGFEDYDYVRNPCIEHFKFTDYKNRVSSTVAHTGRYSLNVGSQTTLKVKGQLNSNGPKYSETQNRVPYNPATFDNYDLSKDAYIAANSTGLYWLKDEDLAGRFGPLYGQATGQTYVLSVWLYAQDYGTPNVTDYSTYGGARFKLNGGVITTSPPKKSAIINGWQKLDYTFTVPANALQGQLWEVELFNTDQNYDVFFDDIRIHPFNSNMACSVYDPVSLRLWAELDDRNFATYYEYDEEGMLIRTKRETEKGVYTVKETRSSARRR